MSDKAPYVIDSNSFLSSIRFEKNGVAYYIEIRQRLLYITGQVKDISDGHKLKDFFVTFDGKGKYFSLGDIGETSELFKSLKDRIGVEISDKIWAEFILQNMKKRVKIDQELVDDDLDILYDTFLEYPEMPIKVLAGLYKNDPSYKKVKALKKLYKDT